MEAMVKVSHSQAFHIPVNAKVAPDYYQVTRGGVSYYIRDYLEGDNLT